MWTILIQNKRFEGIKPTPNPKPNADDSRTVKLSPAQWQIFQDNQKNPAIPVPATEPGKEPSSDVPQLTEESVPETKDMPSLTEESAPKTEQEPTPTLKNEAAPKTKQEPEPATKDKPAPTPKDEKTPAQKKEPAPAVKKEKAPAQLVLDNIRIQKDRTFNLKYSLNITFSA